MRYGAEKRLDVITDIRLNDECDENGSCPTTVFRVGDNRRGTASEHCGDELLKDASQDG